MKVSHVSKLKLKLPVKFPWKFSKIFSKKILLSLLVHEFNSQSYCCVVSLRWVKFSL